MMILVSAMMAISLVKASAAAMTPAGCKVHKNVTSLVAMEANHVLLVRAPITQLWVDVYECGEEVDSAVVDRTNGDLWISGDPEVVYVYGSYFELEFDQFSTSTPSKPRYTQCSNDIDDDGNGLIDFGLDDGCESLFDDEEGGSMQEDSLRASKLMMEWDQRGFLSTLSYDGHVLVDQTKTTKPVFPHDDGSGSATTDWQFYRFEDNPFFPNQWYNGTVQPLWNETNIIHELMATDNGTYATIRSVSFSMSITTNVTIEEGDTLVFSIVTENLLNRSITQFFPVSLGPMQLGNIVGGRISEDATGLVHLSGLRAGSLQRGNVTFCNETKCPGWNEVEARGNAYGAGARYSPVSAIGDTKSAFVGMQFTTYNLSAGIFNRSAAEMFDWVSAPGHYLPMFSAYLTNHIEPLGIRTFTAIFTFNPPLSDINDAKAGVDAVKTAIAPYATYFQAVHGKEPVYCPLGTMGWSWDQANHGWNQSEKIWNPGSTLWELTAAQRYIDEDPPFGAVANVQWQGQIYSTHLTTDGREFEFNPNSDVLDPNVDAACDDFIWKNVTSALEKAGVTLGWFARSASDILDPSTGQSAGLECSGNKVTGIRKGVVKNVDLMSRDLVYNNSLARMQRLVSRGVKAFYIDSYTGSAMYLRDMRKMLLPASEAKVMQVMPEAGTDVIGQLASSLDWFVIGSWNPPFEPHCALIPPSLGYMSTVIGDVGSSGPASSVQVLESSTAASLLIWNQWDDYYLCPALKASYNNNLHLWTSYGKAMGCPEPKKPTFKNCTM